VPTNPTTATPFTLSLPLHLQRGFSDPECVGLCKFIPSELASDIMQGEALALGGAGRAKAEGQAKGRIGQN